MSRIVYFTPLDGIGQVCLDLDSCLRRIPLYKWEDNQETWRYMTPDRRWVQSVKYDCVEPGGGIKWFEQFFEVDSDYVIQKLGSHARKLLELASRPRGLTTSGPDANPEPRDDEQSAAPERHPRDAWMYAQWVEHGKSLKAIRVELARDHPEWDELATDGGVHIAITRYAERIGKPLRPRKTKQAKRRP
jgi:hypothetical protein